MRQDWADIGIRNPWLRGLGMRDGTCIAKKSMKLETKIPLHVVSFGRPPTIDRLHRWT